MNQDEQGKKVDQIIAKAWADAGFKQKLMADPAATLKAEGMDMPANLTFKVVENTDKEFYLVLPARPTELSDDDLDKVAGGMTDKEFWGQNPDGSANNPFAPIEHINWKKF